VILRAAGWHSYTESAMPIYEYRCDNGHTFEVMQKMTDDPVSTCSTCEAPVQRVFHPVAVHFKGKGFYNTDYGTKRRNREMERSGSSSSDSGGGGEKSGSASKESSSGGSESKKPDSSSSGSKESKPASSGGSSGSSGSSSSS
jgi:putative FmdB family regulatory protein